MNTHDLGATMHDLFARLGAEPGLSSPAAFSPFTGLDFLRSIPDGRFPMGEVLGFRLVEVERGRVVFAGKPAFAHYTALGWVHGGWAATLLDSAMGGAALSVLAAGKQLTTLELKVNYVRTLTGETGPLRAEGRVLNAGRTVATAEGRLVGADGRLYAHGSTTCLILADSPVK
jgi:uncharacterized protein (TIGR00369 family)